MARIAPVAHATATGETKALLDGVKARIGMVPNLYATVAHAPSVLKSFLEFSGGLSNGKLDAKERERIALAVGQANACQYCLSAHTAIGKSVGLSDADIAASRKGAASAQRDAAIVALATAIVARSGKLSRADLDAARAGGLDDGEIVEVLGQVVANIFTNYANHIADTDIDFPKVDLSIAA